MERDATVMYVYVADYLYTALPANAASLLIWFI